MSSDSNLCANCKQKIQKDALKAMGKLYHSACFICAVCRRCVDPNVMGKQFYEIKGKPYCEKDYLNTLEKCSVCQKPITDKKLIAQGSNYHANCFVCSVCKKSLDGQTFIFEQNSIYCVEDHQKKFAPKCFSCKLAIVPEPNQKEALRIQVFGNSYHINCFKCEECKSVVNNDTNPCFPLGKTILCKKCFKKKNQSESDSE